MSILKRVPADLVGATLSAITVACGGYGSSPTTPTSANGGALPVKHPIGSSVEDARGQIVQTSGVPIEGQQSVRDGSLRHGLDGEVFGRRRAEPASQ